MNEYCNFEIGPTNEVIDSNGIHYIRKMALEADYSCMQCKEYYNCRYLEILEDREREYKDHRNFVPNTAYQKPEPMEKESKHKKPLSRSFYKNF